MNTLLHPNRTFTAGAICTACNHVLSSEPWATLELKRHAGKMVVLRLPFGDLSFEISSEGLLGVSSLDLSPALILEVSSKDLSGLLGSSGNLRDQAFKAVKITGDADLAQLIGRLGGQLRWEYEEDLAQMIGDAPAHFAVQQGKKWISAGRSAAQDLAESVVEYASEEKKILVNKRDFMSRRNEINDLRDAVERMEKRVQLLERKEK
jgi:ubiquinone biosynthesis accessory factor UbiJ